MSDPKNPRPMEVVYADFANSMKALANKSRVEMVQAGKVAYSKQANTSYKNEVKHPG